MTRIVKILGTGCPKCKNMAAIVQEVVKDNNIAASIEKVEDIMEIMKYNVITTPVLVIDDVVTIKGRVPNKKEVLEVFISNSNTELGNATKKSCCS